jgi:pimeloyl-ACP methyl ester carboxylesterase
MKYSLKFSLLVLTFFTLINQAWALKPSRTYAVMPEKYGMKYKEELITTSDGAKINTWFFESPKGGINSIIVSASGDGNMADNLELINSLLSLGYHVLAYDYRGYGKSSDFTIEPDVYIYPQFITDLNAVCDHLRKIRPTSKFDLYGVGIGAGLALGVGANRFETKRIIADGPWISLEGMKSKIKEKTGKEPVIPFGFDKNFEPEYAFVKTKSRILGVLIIVSPKDELLGPSDMKPLSSAKAIDGVTEIYQVKKSPFNAQNFATDKNAYFEKVSQFLNGK